MAATDVEIARLPASVELKRYELVRQPDEDRWVFVLRSTRNVGKKTVTQALAAPPSP